MLRVFTSKRSRCQRSTTNSNPKSTPHLRYHFIVFLLPPTEIEVREDRYGVIFFLVSINLFLLHPRCPRSHCLLRSTSTKSKLNFGRSLSHISTVPLCRPYFLVLLVCSMSNQQQHQAEESVTTPPITSSAIEEKNVDNNIVITEHCIDNDNNETMTKKVATTTTTTTSPTSSSIDYTKLWNEYPMKDDIWVGTHNALRKEIVALESAMKHLSSKPMTHEEIDHLQTALLTHLNHCNSHHVTEEQLLKPKLIQRIQQKNNNNNINSNNGKNGILPSHDDINREILKLRPLIDTLQEGDTCDKVLTQLQHYENVLLPHMKEEEETMIPLLRKYFTPSEMSPISRQFFTNGPKEMTGSYIDQMVRYIYFSSSIFECFLQKLFESFDILVRLSTRKFFVCAILTWSSFSLLHHFYVLALVELYISWYRVKWNSVMSI